MQELFLFLALLCCLQFSPSSPFTYFEKNDALDHYSCDPDDVLFMEYGNTTCGGRCLATLGCTSIFWNPNYMTCYGCKKTYSSATGLPSDPGARFFWKYSKWGEGCVDNWQCTGSSQECLEVDNEKTCRCSAGHPYDPTTGDCVTNCAVYGDTYQLYPFTKLDGTEISKSWKAIYMTDWGKGCRAECTANSECRSIDHIALGYCHLYSNTKATATLNVNIPYFHYERNCA